MVVQGENQKTIVRWLDYVDKLWPLVLALFSFVFWISGRVETPEAKAVRIQRYTSPIKETVLRNEKEIEKLERQANIHTALGGHGVMEARMTTVERELAELRRSLKNN